MKLISGGIIGNSNYIGTSLNGSIQELLPKGINPFRFIKKFYLNIGDKTSHWIEHSKIKELGTIDFIERKQMIEDMESELTESSEIHSKTDNFAVTEDADVDEDIPMYLKK